MSCTIWCNLVHKLSCSYCTIEDVAQITCASKVLWTLFFASLKSLQRVQVKRTGGCIDLLCFFCVQSAQRAWGLLEHISKQNSITTFGSMSKHKVFAWLHFLLCPFCLSSVPYTLCALCAKAKGYASAVL